MGKLNTVFLELILSPFNLYDFSNHKPGRKISQVMSSTVEFLIVIEQIVHLIDHIQHLPYHGQRYSEGHQHDRVNSHDSWKKLKKLEET